LLVGLGLEVTQIELKHRSIQILHPGMPLFIHCAEFISIESVLALEGRKEGRKEGRREGRKEGRSSYSPYVSYR